MTAPLPGIAIGQRESTNDGSTHKGLASDRAPCCSARDVGRLGYRKYDRLMGGIPPGFRPLLEVAVRIMEAATRLRAMGAPIRGGFGSSHRVGTTRIRGRSTARGATR